MKRLIDADELWDAINRVGGTGAEPGSWSAGYDRGIDFALKLVNAEKTVDVNPVHSHWMFFRGI